MAYFLSTSYAGESLLSGFNWFDGVDLSHGFVSYQNRQNAQSMGLYHIDERTGVVRLGVDSTHNYSVTDKGRPSIRIESKETYDHGLFIADFLHMPPSHCGLWPAFWTYGDNWPFGGEIDIIEGVNTAHSNIISAHTADGCTQGNDIGGLFSGGQLNTQCAVGTNNIGCGFHPSSEDTSSYGDGFNAAHGGVYAMEWDPVHIRIWHFPRGSIPRNIVNKKPNPDTWGQPIAIFGGSECEVDKYFKNMRLVLNINFCGDYGDAVWGKSDQCSDFAPTCSEYVAKNPEAFANAYWDVQYIDAYEFRPQIRNPRPTNSSRPGFINDERTTTITKTTRWTETVTVFATGRNSNVPHLGEVPAATTAAIEPVATRAPVNPIKIDHYSYLGCFYSNSGFQTFHEVADDKDMTLEQCVKLCNSKTYVGVFDSHCFCADNLDAETMATQKEGLCNKVCPGNKFEFCGGIITPKDIDAPREKFVSETLPLHALTLYGCVEEEKPEVPPAMAPGSNGTAVKPEEELSRTVAGVIEVTVIPISEQDAHGKGEQDGDKHDGDKHENDHEGGDQKDEKHDGQKTDGQKTDGQKTDGQKTDGQKTDGQKTDGQKTDGQKTDGQKTDGQKTDGQKTDGQKTDGQKTDGQKTDGQKTDGQKTDGQKTDGQKDEGGKHEGDKHEGDKHDGEKHDGEKHDGEKHDGDKFEDGNHKGDKHDGGDQTGDKHDQDKHEDHKQKGDSHQDHKDKDEAHDWRNHGGDWHNWNNHGGDGHEVGHHESEGKDSSAFSTPSADEEKGKQARPAISEIVIPVTKTVVDCPESITTKEAIVIPTWLPPVEPKPWVPSEPAPPSPPTHENGDDHSHPPPPPPPLSHDGGDDHPHDPPSPPSHDDSFDHSHPPPPPLPPTSTDAPVTGPPVVLVAAASTMYGGLEKYLAILGLSILVLVVRIF